MGDVIGTLGRLGGGHLLEELHAALVATAEDVVATGKSGKVSLSLTIKTKGQGNPIVEIDEALKVTPPSKDARGAFFYALEGDLHRDDPRQTRMELRAVGEQTELRVPDEPGRTLKEIG